VTPPKPKLWVVAAPALGLFLRINSRTHALRPYAVPLPLSLHPFLQCDSWLDCGQVLQCDDFRLRELLNRQKDPERRGVIGAIHPDVRDSVRGKISQADTLPDEMKDAILAALR
jgi:hypothetical protein